MKKVCKICGREFESKHFRACLCSDGCRKENSRINALNYYHSINGKGISGRRKQLFCKICEKPVTYDMSVQRFTHYHEQCVISECINDIKNGVPFCKSKAMKRASNLYGYSKSEIIELLRSGENENYT